MADLDRLDSNRTRIVYAVVVRMFLDEVDNLKASLKDLDAQIVYQRLTSTDKRLIISEEGYPRDEVEPGERSR